MLYRGIGAFKKAGDFREICTSTSSCQKDSGELVRNLRKAVVPVGLMWLEVHVAGSERGVTYKQGG